MSAKSNEGVAKHAVGDASFLCPFSRLWGRQCCHACLDSRPQKGKQACLPLFWYLLIFRGGGGLGRPHNSHCAECNPTLYEALVQTAIEGAHQPVAADHAHRTTNTEKAVSPVVQYARGRGLQAMGHCVGRLGCD